MKHRNDSIFKSSLTPLCQRGGGGILRGLTILIVLVLAASCGTSTMEEGEDYGDLLDSPEDLVLTEEEHTGGWGRSDCTMCHNLENIHLVDRLEGVEIDIEAIHDQAIEDGIAGCAVCHGSNGVP